MSREKTELNNVYIVAVSGGVDSVVLLDMLVKKDRRLGIEDWELERESPQPDFVVAHVDHGIREESGEDAEFVRLIAEKYGLPFEVYQAHLGVGASEDEARQVRYNFLRQCCKKYDAREIITAHHQDDLLETALINLLRGTGWRGLAPMAQVTNVNFQKTNNNQASNNTLCHSRSDRESSKTMDPRILEERTTGHGKSEDDKITIIRPLLGITKKELIAYAKQHDLEWREDSTNANQDYLRNYVRHSLLPNANKLHQDFSKKMLGLIAKTQQLRQEVQSELNNIIVNYHLPPRTYKLPRYQLVMRPSLVAHEVIYYTLTTLDPDWHPSKLQIERVLLFCKTAQPNKTLEVSKRLFLTSSLREVAFQFKP